MELESLGPWSHILQPKVVIHLSLTATRYFLTAQRQVVNRLVEHLFWFIRGFVDGKWLLCGLP